MELSESQGRAAAELSAANVLLQLEAALGDLGRLRGLLRVDGYVASADAWTAQPKVLDAASELFTAVLGDRGRHARSAVHVPRLPLNAAVKLVTTFIAAPGTDR
jgi:enamine deaminase RidA (YjgF/YER057c/UK114 family)